MNKAGATKTPMSVAWDAVSRDRDAFTAWIDRHVRGTADWDEYRRSLAEVVA